jgi:hypothetical protein
VAARPIQSRSSWGLYSLGIEVSSRFAEETL